MKRTVFAVCALWLAACNSAAVPQQTAYPPMPSYTPEPTYTPFPTYTPYPTFTPLPAAPPTAAPPTTASVTASPTPRSSQAAGRCIAWEDAAAHMGKTVCVRGTVYTTNRSGSTFFIDFDDTRESFYGVSFKYTWTDLDGQCVEMTGPVSEYRGRPQIIIESREQLQVCED